MFFRKTRPINRFCLGRLRHGCVIGHEWGYQPSQAKDRRTGGRDPYPGITPLTAKDA
jgi:hypothetical protein